MSTGKGTVESLGPRLPLLFVEAGVLLYLLTTPFGRSFPLLLRHLMLASVLVGVIGRHVIGAHRQIEPPYRFVPAAVLFGVSTVVSVVLSADPAFSLRASHFLPIALLLFFAIQHLAADPARTRRLCAALLVVIVVLSADGCYQFVSGASFLAGAPPRGSRVTGSIPHPNDLAIIPILLPLGMVVLATTGHRVVRWLIGGVLPLAIVTLVLSQSRNAWIGLVACLCVWAAFGAPRRLALGLGAAIVVVFLIAIVADVGNVQQRLISFTQLEREGRIGIWLVAWHMFLDTPIVGLGAHMFGPFYLDYLARIDLPPGYVPEVAYMPWAHNVYLELLCERGVIGFAVFAGVVGAAIRRLARCMSTSMTPGIRAYAIGLTGSLTVFLVMALVDLTFLKDWVTLVFWLMVALIARLPDLCTAAAPAGASVDPDDAEDREH